MLEGEELQEVIGESVDVPLSYISAEELQRIIDSALGAPAELVKLLRAAFNE